MTAQFLAKNKLEIELQLNQLWKLLETAKEEDAEKICKEMLELSLVLRKTIEELKKLDVELFEK